MAKYFYIQEHMIHTSKCMLENQVFHFYNIVDGSQPIAIFHSLDKSVEFFGGLDMPNFYHNAEVDNIVSSIYGEVYTNIEIDAIGDELSNLILHTYIKTETDNLISSITLTGSENIEITAKHSLKIHLK